jgi:hypothetical protein
MAPNLHLASLRQPPEQQPPPVGAFFLGLASRRALESLVHLSDWKLIENQTKTRAPARVIFLTSFQRLKLADCLKVKNVKGSREGFLP